MVRRPHRCNPKVKIKMTHLRAGCKWWPRAAVHATCAPPFWLSLWPLCTGPFLWTLVHGEMWLVDFPYHSQSDYLHVPSHLHKIPIFPYYPVKKVCMLYGMKYSWLLTNQLLKLIIDPSYVALVDLCGVNWCPAWVIFIFSRTKGVKSGTIRWRKWTLCGD